MEFVNEGYYPLSYARTPYSPLKRAYVQAVPAYYQPVSIDAYRTSASPLRSSPLKYRNSFGVARTPSSPLRASGRIYEDARPSSSLGFESPPKRLKTTKPSYNRRKTCGRKKGLRRSKTKSINPRKSVRFDMIDSHPELQKLVNVFIAQIKLDADVEVMRRELALRKDFNLMDAFRVFDQITHNNLHILKTITPTKNHLSLLNSPKNTQTTPYQQIAFT